MDLITDFPITAIGHVSILLVVDRPSKIVYIEAINKTVLAKHLAAVYTDRVFEYHVVRQSIVSNRAPRFISLIWRELTSHLSTKLHIPTAYHPQSNVQTERVNAVLEDTLRQFVCF